MIIQAGNLEPLNIFLYTWRLLATLEREEENITIKKALSWFATLTDVNYSAHCFLLWAVPQLYYCLIAAIVVVETYYYNYNYQGDVDLVAHWYGILVALFQSLGYLILLTNCLGSLIMVLVVRFTRKLTQ